MNDKNREIKRERIKLIKTTAGITFLSTFAFWTLLHVIVYKGLPGPLAMLVEFICR